MAPNKTILVTPYKQDVGGSNPSVPTLIIKELREKSCNSFLFWLGGVEQDFGGLERIRRIADRVLTNFNNSF